MGSGRSAILNELKFSYMQLTFGLNVAYGGGGTEFGGFKIPGTDLLAAVPNSAFAWLTYYF